MDAGDASARDAGARDAGDPPHEGGVCTYDPSVAPRADCPNDVPSACADPAPSYSATVATIFRDRCSACHRVGGLAADKPFDSYAHEHKRSGAILTAVAGCVMPPPCAPQPTSQERGDLLMWLVCDAPDN